MAKQKEQAISDSPRAKWLKGLIFVLLLCFYASFLVHPIALPVGDDLPRLIKNGEMIVQGHFEVLTKNVYSYTEPDHKFANHHWLSGVVFYFLDQTVGWNGQVIFKVLVLLAAFSILFAAALKKADFWLVAFFSIPTILILRERTFVRPEIFSYLLIAIYLYVLMDLDKHPERKRIFWLIPLQLLWVNLHLFFGVGILMVAGFLFEKIRHNQKDPDPTKRMLIKRLSVMLLALVLVSLINPFGFRGALSALEINITKDFPVTILETRSLSDFIRQSSYWADISVGLFQPLVIALVLSFLFSLRKKPIFFFLASIGTAVLTSGLVRAIPLFGMVFLLVISANLGEDTRGLKEWLKQKWPRQAKIVSSFLLLVFIVAVSYLTLFHIPSGVAKYPNWDIGLTRNSNAAAEFFLEQGLRGPVFNDADVGSYLIYHLYPQEKVFVDNRFGDAYSSSFFRNIYASMMDDEKKWKEAEAQYHLNAIFLFQYDKWEYTRPFLYRRMDDPTWALVYGDNYNLILLKRIEQNQNIIDRFEITADNALDKLKNLLNSEDSEMQISGADILNLVRREDLALEVFQRVVAQHPDNGRVWKVLGEMSLLYIDEPDPVLAAEYLEKALSAGERTSETYGLLGLAYRRSGLFLKAEDALLKALEIDPDLSDASELLEEVRALMSGKMMEQIQEERWQQNFLQNSQNGGGE